MSCLGYKGGIGSSSRVVPQLDATLGVLALTNFGGSLRIDGVPVRRLLEPAPPPNDAGSCIVVLATDAQLSPHQLERIARRAGLGLARTGSVAYHGSGEIFVAFATGDERSVGDDELNPLFEAAVDATEEAVVNSLWAAQDVTGRDGHVVEALPHEETLDAPGSGGAAARTRPVAAAVHRQVELAAVAVELLEHAVEAEGASLADESDGVEVDQRGHDLLARLRPRTAPCPRDRRPRSGRFRREPRR